MHLIELTLTKRTSTQEDWLIATNGRLASITTKRNRNRRGLDNLRYVICKALFINASTFRFIRNVNTNGRWISEWMKL